MVEVSLRHRFPHTTLDISFQAGVEIVVLFGPSGVGKSLTVRTIAGLFTPETGYVRVNGEVWLDTEHGINLRPQVRRVGYVPQHYGLFPHLSVAGNIAFSLREMPHSEREHRLHAMIDLMQLHGLEHRYPHELSGGQQQRVALARALVIEPRILLLDEALSALDPLLREELQDAVRLIQRHYRIPVILITHDLQEAYTLADKLVVLQEGRVVQIGTQEDVFRRPATPQVARAVGMRNIYTGTVVGHTLDSTEVTWAGGSLLVPRISRPRGATVTFGIRPEDVLFVREQRPLRQTHNIVDVIVEEEHPTGFDHLVRMRLVQDTGVVLWARLPRFILQNLGVRPGQRRRVLLRQRALHVFAGDT